MQIQRLRVNHIENPIGYLLDKISLSWTVMESTGTYTAKARVKIALDSKMGEIIYDSAEREDIDCASFSPDITLEPGVRYYWQVEVWDDAGGYGKSDVAFFETAVQMDMAQWIRAPFPKEVQPIFRKKFTIPEEIISARLYICGLGLYEAYINGEKIGDEYLCPHYNDYDLWLQYQTYDLTGQLQQGENCIGVLLGNGWYKGRFGWSPWMDSFCGDNCHLICELHMEFADGSRQIIPSDTSWLCAPSPVLQSSIYDGEVWDSRMEIPNWSKVSCNDKRFVSAIVFEADKGRLTPRLSPPVKIMERIKPIALLHTDAEEWVLDFGQEMTGWVAFYNKTPKDTEILLQYGEILQNGKFYNDNLRSAKAEYRYISNGKQGWVRPHFTFYGFRYVKIQGIQEIQEIDLVDFVGCILYSQMPQTGYIETSNEKVNRLFANALWGQKGNFLDTPTDCPQRDERMGWTGDAQVFSATACFNMYTPAFYKKYLYDMKLEQDTLGGSVPYVVPNALEQMRRVRQRAGKTITMEVMKVSHGSCAWGDAATVIPWNLYQFYGDKTMLAQQYENMKSWVDYIRKVDVERCGGRYLWMDGFHFADWLSLDNFHKDSCYGATDPYLIASAYYYYSAKLTEKAATELGKTEDVAYYGDLASHVKGAFLEEYYSRTGRLVQETQTALALVLWLDLIPEGARQRQVDTLLAKLKEENMHLTTGFVGTPLLCPVLTENGHVDVAYTLLLQEDYPSWLYEVNMGATTIWERWNSVLPDGSISDTGMNSLNHYAYGSIVEWMYRYMCGLNPSAPGYKRFTLQPYPDERFDWVRMAYESPYGMIRSEWEKQGNGILYTVEVPFDTEANFILNGNPTEIKINGETVLPGNDGKTIRLQKGISTIYVEQGTN